LREALLFQTVEEDPDGFTPTAITLESLTQSESEESQGMPFNLEDELQGLNLTVRDYSSGKDLNQVYDPIKENAYPETKRRRRRLLAEDLPLIQNVDQIEISLIRKFRELYFSDSFRHEIATEGEGDHYLVGTYKAYDGDAFEFTLVIDGNPISVQFTNGAKGATKTVDLSSGPKTIHFWKKELFAESGAIALYRGEKVRTFSVGFEIMDRKEITR
jgi:hypothetical protein